MSTYYVANVPSSSDSICHFGIKGQKWGIRRFQNSDGTLTPEGKARYGTRETFENYRKYKQAKGLMGFNAFNVAADTALVAATKGKAGKELLALDGILAASSAQYLKSRRDTYAKTLKRDTGRDLYKEESDARKKKLKIAAGVAGGIVATALATKGAMAFSDLVEKGNAEWLKTGRDNIELVFDAIGSDKVKASFGEKFANAVKYYSGKSKRGMTQYALNP